MQAAGQDAMELELTLPSEGRSIKRARDAVARLAERVGAPVSDVKLAVSEAVTNSIVHGYRDGAEGNIVVCARVERGRMVVAVVDEGTGMKPHLDGGGLGVGISVMTALASDVRFDSSRGGLTVSMSFEAPDA